MVTEPESQGAFGSLMVCCKLPLPLDWLTFSSQDFSFIRSFIHSSNVYSIALGRGSTWSSEEDGEAPLEAEKVPLGSAGAEELPGRGSPVVEVGSVFKAQGLRAALMEAGRRPGRHKPWQSHLAGR